MIGKASPGVMNMSPFTSKKGGGASGGMGGLGNGREPLLLSLRIVIRSGQELIRRLRA